MVNSSLRTIALVLPVISLWAQAAWSEVQVTEEERDGKKVVVLKNRAMKAVLVPELARFPLSYVLEATGHEMFAHPSPLSTPNRGFQYYGGIVDSLPWVGGKPKKGLLYTSEWQWTTGTEDGRAWFRGKTSVTYKDPVDGHDSALAFEKRVTAFKGSTALRMGHLIRNVGETDARFLFVNHARACVAGYTRGDYCFAPGDKCFVYHMRGNRELESKGVRPPCWTKWPLDEAIVFRPQEELRTVLTFVPAPWCAAGDDKTKEVLFFVGGPFRCGERTDSLKMGMFLTNAGYVIEPSLSYCLDAIPEEWREAALTLKPGEECTYQLHLIAYHGLSRQDVLGAVVVYPECVVLQEPKMVDASNDRVRFSGKIACHSPCRLEMRRDRSVVAKREIETGVFDLGKVGDLGKHARKTAVVLVSPLGERVLGEF